ncbi:unnamed protein product [Pieris brassicae]|uniref:THAP-type domain-containing protein n=1 Tax=Pieris brassicae TaxID=7116 RepID=A0A9P0X6G2_PIEBR|nr:unnamed protein product [Pieris brassicae]
MALLWEKALNRRNFKATNSSRLCSEHFIESDYEGVSSSTANIAREQRYLKRHNRKTLVFPSTAATEIDINIPSIPEDTIEDLFQVPDFQVAILFMNCEKKIEIWPSHLLVDYYTPDLLQQARFSSYKHHNIIKFLVGALPGCLISFCSDGYADLPVPPPITYRRNNLVAVIDEKDAIMADCGLNVKDQCEQKDVAIYLYTNIFEGSITIAWCKIRKMIDNIKF